VIAAEAGMAQTPLEENDPAESVVKVTEPVSVRCACTVAVQFVGLLISTGEAHDTVVVVAVGVEGDIGV
jgi:hypothetical protein